MKRSSSEKAPPKVEGGSETPTADGLALAVDRRTALKGISAAALGGAILPGCGGGGSDPEGLAGPTEVTPALLRERIDTVVVLMLENRSFDHYFGARSLLEAEPGLDGLVDGMSNPHPDGTSVFVHPADKNCIEDPPHSWTSSHNQFNDGANDGFVSEHHQRHGDEEAHRVMGYFDRSTLPVFYALADAYALCQRWFCSLMTSTWPNRFYMLAAQNGGVFGNSAATVPDGDGGEERLVFPSIFDRMTDAGVPWGVYFSNAPFSMLLPSIQPSNETFTTLDDFFTDAAVGALPRFTFLEPAYGRNDDHPPTHPVAGQVLVASIYEALASSPHWSRCLFIVTYDEHGGFFDHVPPPTAADALADEGFDQLGFRVPALVAGPWVRSGHLSDTVYDHTSILALAELLWELEPLTERDAAANDLTDLLDQERLLADAPAEPAVLPVVEANEDEIYAPECLYSPVREHSESLFRAHHLELDEWIDANAAGTFLDRRWDTDGAHRRLVARAIERGLLKLR
ncbi:MAG: phosphoesterase [Deltaproteobacteria bacterium]|nr:phosphoesterase [Deltaproteobacteria bacterium]